MKRYLLISLLVIFIAPSVAFASWWNPFTWKVFNKAVEQPIAPLITNSDITNVNNLVDAKKVKISEVIKKNKPTIPIPKTTEINSTPIVVKTQNAPKKSEIDELKETIDNLNQKVENLEKKNYVKEERIDKFIKFNPEVTLDKKVINNDGNDSVQVKIKTVNDDGSVVSNKEIVVITSTGSDGGLKETKTGTVISDSNGNATYNTPTTTAYDRCGVFMSITVKIDNNFIFGKTIQVHNIKQVQSGGGTCS